tara:strand:+ start:1717 stop:2319 length:603 start_codon:yes stop_codon:yes gene_type:complete
MKEASNPIPAGRLQRAALNQETYISSFSQVLLRHGLTMVSIAIICLLIPSIQSALMSALDNLFKNPLKYLLWTLAVATFIFGFLKYRKREIDLHQLFWIGYLFLISLVEEIAFRLSLPLLITADFTGISFFWLGALFSNLLFATIHYFTLRWKLNACIFTFLGGMGFSRMLDTTGDLTAVILLHWAITFLNTPSAPKSQN